jgi:hypothetical protein
MWTTDPAKAFATESPGGDIADPAHQEHWEQPRAFVKWFMENYRNDNRVLAVEVMNEPTQHAGKEPPTMPFAISMFKTARAMQGTVPLTMGTQHIDTAEKLIPLGLDIIEFHHNFPQSVAEMEQTIEAAIKMSEQYHLPAWLTEWQRVRPNGPGWDVKSVPKSELEPDYTSLAATVQKYPVGNFFWSLMVKRAYLPSQRGNGTINGLFWPDGSVWSLKEARDIAKDPALNLMEKNSVPAGFLDYLTARK